MVSATTKYWALLVLGVVMAVGTYLEGQTTLTWAVALSAVMTGVAFLVSEFESESTATTQTTP